MYSAFNARVFASTAVRSILNAISLKLFAVASPRRSASVRAIPDVTAYEPPAVVPASANSGSLLPPSAANAAVPPANAVPASLCNASVPPCVVYLERIAKISPVGPVIGCTPATSYAIRLGIARRTSEIRIGSYPCILLLLFAVARPRPSPPALDGVPSFKLFVSRIAFSWFSKRIAVTLLR